MTNTFLYFVPHYVQISLVLVIYQWSVVNFAIMEFIFSHPVIPHGGQTNVRRHDLKYIRYNLVTSSKYIFCVTFCTKVSYFAIIRIETKSTIHFKLSNVKEF